MMYSAHCGEVALLCGLAFYWPPISLPGPQTTGRLGGKMTGRLKLKCASKLEKHCGLKNSKEKEKGGVGDIFDIAVFCQWSYPELNYGAFQVQI